MSPSSLGRLRTGHDGREEIYFNALHSSSTLGHWNKTSHDYPFQRKRELYHIYQTIYPTSPLIEGTSDLSQPIHSKCPFRSSPHN